MVKVKSLGFTLIEVLVVMAIIATLVSLVAPRYFGSVDRAKESALRHDLSVIRDAIDKYYSDTGTYPDNMQSLVDGRYLRSLPEDPVTQSTQTWLVQTPPDPYAKGNLYDIHSGATGAAADGTLYAEW